MKKIHDIKYVFVFMAILLLINSVTYSVMSSNNSNKKVASGVYTIKSNTSPINVSFQDAKVLWSYPLSGIYPHVGPAEGVSDTNTVVGNIGVNITGDGFADFLLMYDNSVYKNATLTAVDGGTGKIIWEDNFENFIVYNMGGTLGKIPLIYVFTGNVQLPVGMVPFRGPGYLNITLINGINGSIIWNVTNYLPNVNNGTSGVFFTTNNTIFASTDPIITTYEVFTETPTTIKGVYLYNITLIGIRNINGSLAFKQTYSTLSVAIYIPGSIIMYYPTYLSVDQIPGLETGGVIYMYILSNSTGLDSGVVLLSSTGKVIWNRTSKLDALLLSDGTTNQGSIAVGNFTGGRYYDIAVTIISFNQTFSEMNGLEVFNITTGNVLYTALYPHYEDPTVMQSMGWSVSFFESALNIDNVSASFGPTLRIGNVTPIILRLYIHTPAIQYVIALNILNNTYIWNTTIIIRNYGVAVAFYHHNIPYIMIFTRTLQFMLLNGTNGKVCSYLTTSQISDYNAVLLPMVGSSPDVYTNVSTMYRYIPKNGTLLNYQYNISLFNPFTNQTIAKNIIKMNTSGVNRNLTYTTTLTSVAYLGFKDYVTANVDENYSGLWMDKMYIMSDNNLSTVWEYTAQGFNQDPALMINPTWNFIRWFNPQYGDLSVKPNSFVFPVQTSSRFYMLQINYYGPLMSEIVPTANTGYAPLHDVFSVVATGGVPSYYYKWYVNGSYANYGGKNFSVVFSSAGKYNISVVVTDQLNHTVTASDMVDVYPHNKTSTETYYLLSGVVYNVNNLPLANVSVYINSSFFVNTMYNGSFSFHLLKGNYTLIFIKDGYISYYDNVSLTSNITYLRITLTPIKVVSYSPPSTNTNNIVIYEIIIGAVILTGIVIIVIVFVYPSYKKRRG
ncbi:MAG: hypothetical protein ACP5RS_00155 [Thermoplasmata archaeon]